MHKKSAIIIIVILSGVIVIGALLINRHIRIQSPIVFLDEPQQIVNEDTSTEVFRRDGIEQPEIVADTANTPPAPTREELRRKYARSAIIVDSECAMVPGSITIKPQQKLLIENDSMRKRDIEIGPRLYTVDAEDYVIGAFTEEGTFSVSCDGSKARSGRIVIKD